MKYDTSITTRADSANPAYLTELHEEYTRDQSFALADLPLPPLAPPTSPDPNRPRAVERRALLDSAVSGDAQVVVVSTKPADHYYCEDCDEQIAMEDVDQILDDMEPTCPHCGECVDFVYGERPA